MMKLVCATVPVLIVFSLHAQQGMTKITGRVLNMEGYPVENLSVVLKKAKRLTFTDANGKFQFTKLDALMDTLEISAIDLTPLRIPVELHDAEMVDIGIVHLSYNIKELQNVEIKGRILKSYKSDYSFLATKTETPLKDLPQSISTVTKELIKDKMEFTRKEAIDAAAGVTQYSGYDEYTIRGFRAENASNINGLRGYNTTYTSSMLVNIERIEIIKGPVASLYGNGDPGGTINMVTKKPLDTFGVTLDLYSGSWNHFRGMTDVTGSVNNRKTLLYRFNAGYDDAESYRDQFVNKSYQLAPSFSFIPNDRFRINVDFSLSHVNTVLDRGQPGFKGDQTLTSTPINLTMSQPGDYLKETDLAIIAGASYKISKKLSVNIGYLHYGTRQQVANHGLKDYITEDSVYLFFTRWNYRTVTNTLSDYFVYQVKTGKASHRLLFGHDLVKSKITLDQSVYELPGQFGVGSGIVGTFSLRHPRYSQRQIKDYEASDNGNDGVTVDGNAYQTNGIYIQDFIRLGKWKFLAGIRQEFYHGESGDSSGVVDQKVLTARAGIVYAVTPSWSVYTSFNTGFDPFETSLGKAQQFQELLKPVRSSLIEAGIKSSFFANRLNASLAVYRLTVRNIAVNANDISRPDLYVQQGEDRSLGTELEINGNILPDLNVSFSYAYCNATITKSKIEEDVGKTVENSPHHLSAGWFNYTLSKGRLKGLGVSIGHHYADRRSTLENGIDLPSYFILNGSIHYRFQKFTVGALISNITGKTYWMAAYNNVSKWPGAPRNILLNIGYAF
jgi:iron complex outermembrane receptor protein